MGTTTEQGTPNTRDNESATVAGQGDEDESGNDDKHDDPDEPKHDEHDTTNEAFETINVNILQVDGNASFTSDNSESSQYEIPVHITNRNPSTAGNIRFGPQNINTIKRSNKYADTL